MKTVNLVITSCTECPHCDISRDYTEDSFETCFRWVCKFDIDKPRDIRRYVDWNDNKKHIPDWCPLIIKERTIPTVPQSDREQVQEGIPNKKSSRYRGHYGSQGDQGK